MGHPLDVEHAEAAIEASARLGFDDLLANDDLETRALVQLCERTHDSQDVESSRTDGQSAYSTASSISFARSCAMCSVRPSMP